MKPATRHLRMIKAAILIPAVVVMAFGLFAPIHGNFYFRQAHVAANIEKYVAHGLSMTPETYNLDIPYSLFDFPVYQLAAAGIIRVVGGDALVVARLLSILAFVLTFIVIDRLLTFTVVPVGQGLFVLFFFTYAPLNLFYFQTPLVDCLAVFLSIFSMYGLVRWDVATSPLGQSCFWLLFVLSAVVSTLIKNPVYLPAFLAGCAFVFFKYRWKSFLRPGFIAYVGLVAGAVIVFKLHANAVNQVSGFFDASEVGDYFGPVVDRLDPLSWRRVAKVLTTQTMNGLAVILAMVGLVSYLKDSREEYRSLYLGFSLGGFAALLVFFNRYTWHNYYQLPLVFPLAFLAGSGAFYLLSLLGGRGRVQKRFTWAQAVLVLLLVLSSLYWAVDRYPELSGTPTRWIASNGEWIRDHSDPDDFVLYILDTSDSTDWNPVFLYFAKRDGFNLPRRKVRDRVLKSLVERFSSRYRRILVFCPVDLQERMSSRLEAAGAKLAEAGPNGMLYQLQGPN